MSPRSDLRGGTNKTVTEDTPLHCDAVRVKPVVRMGVPVALRNVTSYDGCSVFFAASSSFSCDIVSRYLRARTTCEDAEPTWQASKSRQEDKRRHPCAKRTLNATDTQKQCLLSVPCTPYPDNLQNSCHVCEQNCNQERLDAEGETGSAKSSHHRPLPQSQNVPGQVHLQRLNVLVKPKSAHRPKDVVPVDGLALLTLALVRRLRRDEGHKLGDTLLDGILPVFRDFGGGRKRLWDVVA